MGYQLGIDLGTTYTAAAVCRSSDRGWVEPEVVTLGSRSATVPSVLFLAPDGSVLVGEAAERRALTDPDRVVREFKRRIGDPTPIVVAGRTWAPEELSARLVRWVVDRVAEREGGPADRIAITHPASWGSAQEGPAGPARWPPGPAVTFLAEPQAAALHYASAERVGAGSTIAVYDLGGGTFDAAVVRKADAASAGSGPAGFGLLGRPEGLERLGGIDFDEVVFEHVRAGLPEAFDDLDDTDPARAVRGGPDPARLHRGQGGAERRTPRCRSRCCCRRSRGSVRLHRSEFEQLIRPQVEETVDALRTAVGSAGLSPGAAHRGAAGRRLVADPAGGAAGLRAARPPGRGGRRPEERDREGRRARAVPEAERRLAGSGHPARRRDRRAHAWSRPGCPRRRGRRGNGRGGDGRRWPGRAPEPPAAARRAPARLDTLQLRTAQRGARHPAALSLAGQRGAPPAGHPGPGRRSAANPTPAPRRSGPRVGQHAVHRRHPPLRAVLGPATGPGGRTGLGRRAGLGRPAAAPPAGALRRRGRARRGGADRRRAAVVAGLLAGARREHRELDRHRDHAPRKHPPPRTRW